MRSSNTISVYDTDGHGCLVWLEDIDIDRLRPGDLCMRAHDGLLMMLIALNDPSDCYWDVRYTWRRGSVSRPGTWWSDANVGGGRFVVVSRS